MNTIIFRLEYVVLFGIIFCLYWQYFDANLKLASELLGLRWDPAFRVFSKFSKLCSDHYVAYVYYAECFLNIYLYRWRSSNLVYLSLHFKAAEFDVSSGKIRGL